MKKVRIALIGLGRFGQSHAAAIATSQYANVVDVAACTEATCRKVHIAAGEDGRRAVAMVQATLPSARTGQ